MMKHSLTLCLVFAGTLTAFSAGDRALDALMDRISPGLSEKITVVLAPAADSLDYFTVDSAVGMPRITANNRVSAATGLNHYLKHTAGVQLTWDCMNPELPSPLPLPEGAETRRTDQKLRYYLNYCTHSYSLPFADARRWQQEIDWMALHGINAPLAMTGTDAVWDATLRRLGYPEEKIDSFIAAPVYQAWWLMNNLEGEGAPMTDAQLRRQTELQKSIIAGMRELDMEPVFPGYSGMVPHDAARVLGLNAADPGLWCGFTRPAFLQPTDPAFAGIARIYYEEQKRLYGPARYYSMDPFHEGGNTEGVDLAAAARAIDGAMRQASPGSVWIIQGWGGNPRPEILDAIPADRMTVLDLNAESVPMWNTRGHRRHPWLWCMLLNFGGNEGLFGKLDYVAEAYDSARRSDTPPAGIGLTMEGINNNPVMYELVSELPWSTGRVDTRRWLRSYLESRYGGSSANIDSAWTLLAGSVYGASAANRQQGTTESVFCARPSDNPVNASTWANSEPYYDGRDVIKAASLMLSEAPRFGKSPHYIHDLVDITRQAIAEAGRMEARRFSSAASRGDSAAYRASARRFLSLIDLQDSLLATLPQFRVGSWIADARNAAATPDLADDMERDARTLITTWGPRQASETGQLHDYAHREWQGVLADFYKPRWETWFDARLDTWGSGQLPRIDFYAIEEPWARSTGGYSPEPEGDPIKAAAKALRFISGYLE